MLVLEDGSPLPGLGFIVCLTSTWHVKCSVKDGNDSLVIIQRYSILFYKEGGTLGTRNTAQQLRALAALAEDSSLVPSTHMAAHTCL